jgi:Ca2+-binding RTX toxin-like protein
VEFADGETTQIISVLIRTDEIPEGDETFSIVLSGPEGATIISDTAYGTISNDDVLANTAPTNIRLTTGGTTVIVDENKSTGTTIATVTADDDAGAAALRYSLATADANFEIDEISGQIKVKAGANLNFEGVKTFTLSVKVRDLNGSGLETVQDITINLADVNEAPLLGAAVTAVTIGENAALGDTVASFTLDDADAGEEFVYEILGIPAAFAGAFAVDTVNRKIVVADRSKLAVAGTQNFTLTLKVTDKNGGAGSFSDTQDFIITVQDIPPGNTAPENIRLTTGEAEVSVSESMAAGQTIARVMADDNGPASELRYYIADNPHFVIDELSGEIKIRSGVRLNYEAEGSHTVTVTVKDLNGIGAASTHDFVINIDDVNEAATGIDFTSLRIVKAKATLKDANVVLATAVDPDTNVEYRDNLYRFANGTTTDGIFTINAITGQITTNREITSVDVGDHLLKIVAYDSQNPNLARTISYTITVVPADNMAPTITGVVASGKGEAGVGVEAGKFLILENQGAGAVADVNAADGDGDTLTYSLINTGGLPAGVFSIDANTGVISMTDPAALNLDADNDYVLMVQVSDGKGGTVTQDVTIRVKDAAVAPDNSAPTGLSLNGSLVGSINEYAQVGKEIGTLAATDANGDALTYTLLDNAGGRFAILGNKLVLAGPGVNFEEAKSHQIKVQVSDGKGGVEEKTISINVTDETTLVLNGKTKNDKLNGGAQDDILNGKKGNDTVKGLAGDDKLYGDVGDDKVYGGEGLDTLSGGKGNDKLYGEAGNDVLFGDEGNDVLTGGLGSDAFVFAKKANKTTNFDQIKDFRSGEDKIFLENSIFKKLGAAGTIDAPAKLDASMFSVGKAKDKNDFLVYKKGVLYYDTNGKTAGGEVEIVKVKGLKATDIFII